MEVDIFRHRGKGRQACAMCSSLGLRDVLLDLIGQMPEFTFRSFRAFSIFLEIFAWRGMPIVASSLLLIAKSFKPPITGRLVFLVDKAHTDRWGNDQRRQRVEAANLMETHEKSDEEAFQQQKSSKL